MQLEERFTPAICTVLRAVRTPRQPHGFRSIESLQKFMKDNGVMGFHNIREITPTMVGEIKTAIQSLDQAGA